MKDWLSEKLGTLALLAVGTSPIWLGGLVVAGGVMALSTAGASLLGVGLFAGAGLASTAIVFNKWIHAIGENPITFSQSAKDVFIDMPRAMTSSVIKWVGNHTWNKPREAFLKAAESGLSNELKKHFNSKAYKKEWLQHRDVFGSTPLIRAAENGRTEIVRMLLEQGASVQDTNNSGGTALIEACDYRGNSDTARLLIENKADIEAKDCLDVTPLMKASLNGHANTVRLLLAQGADPTLINKQCQTALSWAEERKHDGIVQALREAMAQRKTMSLAPKI